MVEAIGSEVVVEAEQEVVIVLSQLRVVPVLPEEVVAFDGMSFGAELFPVQAKRCQTAPKIDPQSASNFDPLELSVMASPRGRGGGAYWLLCLSLQLSLPVSMISQ